MWLKDFNLSNVTVSKLRTPVNQSYNARINLENICLVIEDLINQVKDLPEHNQLTFIVRKNAESVYKIWDKQNIFLEFPVIQIKADTNEI